MKKRKELLCHFSPFLHLKSFFPFSPPATPPAFQAGSLEMKEEMRKKAGVSRETHTSLNIQNIKCEMTEELSILF